MVGGLIGPGRQPRIECAIDAVLIEKIDRAHQRAFSTRSVRVVGLDDTHDLGNSCIVVPDGMTIVDVFSLQHGCVLFESFGIDSKVDEQQPTARFGAMVVGALGRGANADAQEKMSADHLAIVAVMLRSMNNRHAEFAMLQVGRGGPVATGQCKDFYCGQLAAYWCKPFVAGGFACQHQVSPR